MLKQFASICLSWGWLLSASAAAPNWAAVLQPVAVETRAPVLPGELGFDPLWDQSSRQVLVGAIDHSLRYLQTPVAAAAYQHPVNPDFTLDRVRRSLQRFRQLVLTADNPGDLQAVVQREFDFYQSIGHDGLGTVDFTGYFEPTYSASRVPTAEYRYPLYRLPPDLGQWSRPHPTRLQLEGDDGLQGAQGRLRGLELVWLRDRLEAFLVQVQGSARLQLTDGSTMTVGYAGHTDYPYTGIGRQLVNDGKFTLEELTLPRLIEYFRQHPADLNRYLPRNDRFVFFTETAGAPATGSLGVPVTAERSIATDRTLMPPGALALIHTELPIANAAGEFAPQSRYVLDQDTGGAIRGAGRVDVFMGTGVTAGDRAGMINASGQLYYLLLKD
jgi:membrane-bound lytic murein transglycosylase A